MSVIIMSEERFFVKVYSNNEPFFFDEKQEYVEEIYTVEEVRNLHPMAYWQVVDLLNQLSDENEQLRELLKDAEDEIETLKKSNQNLMWSLVKP